MLGLLILLACDATSGTDPSRPTVELSVGPYRFRAELAQTAADRQLGLMGRTSLPEDQGMLFVFPSMQRHCMWMRDTLIPLSVAFLDAEGEILNLADMTPLSDQTHCAAARARYALEMHQGWFTRRGILPGHRLDGLDRLPGAR